MTTPDSNHQAKTSSGAPSAQEVAQQGQSQPKRARTWPRWVLLPLILLAVLAWTMLTQTGTRALVNGVAFLLHGQLQVGQVQGRLADQFEIDSLVWKGADVQLDFTQIKIHWQPAALLLGRVDVQEIQAQKLAVWTRKHDQALLEPAHLVLPLDIKIAQAQLSEFVLGDSLGEAKQSVKVRLHALHASVDSNATRHQVRWRLGSEWGSLQAQVVLKANRPFDIQSQFEYRGQVLEDLPQLALQGSLNGNLARMQLQAQPLYTTEQTPASLVAAQAKFDIDLQIFQTNVIRSAQLFVRNLDPRALHRQAPQARLDIDMQILPKAPREDKVSVKKKNRLSALTTLGEKLLPPSEKTVTSSSSTSSLWGRITIRNHEAGPWDQSRVPVQQLNADIRWSPQVIHIDQVRVQLSEGRVDGQLQWLLSDKAQTHKLNSKWQVQEVNLSSLDTRLKPSQIAGQVSLQTREKGRIDFQAQLKDPRACLNADAYLLLDKVTSLHLSRFELSADQSQVLGQAEVKWGEQAELRGQLKLVQLDPSKWIAMPKASLDGELQVALTWAPSWKLHLQVPRLTGEIAGKKISGSSLLQWQEGQTLKVDYAQMQWGQNYLQARGRLGAEQDELLLEINADDLALLTSWSAQAMSGRVALTARARGGLQAPRWEAQVKAEDVRWPKRMSVAYANAEVAGVVGANEHLQVNLQAQQVRWGAAQQGLNSDKVPRNWWHAAQTLRELRVNLSGSRADHVMHAEAQGLDGQNLNLRLSGQLDDKAPQAMKWQGRIEQAQFSGLQASEGARPGSKELDLSLQQASSVSLARDSLVLGPMRLRGQLGKLDIEQVAWSPGRLIAQGRASDMPAQIGLNLLKLNDRFRGDLMMAADWDIALKEQMHVNLNLNRQSGDIAYLDQDGSGQALGLGISGLQLSMQGGISQGLAPQVLRLQWQAKGNRLGTWQGQAETQLARESGHWLWHSDLPLKAHMQASIQDLQWIASQLSSELVGKGQLTMAAKLDGSFAKPRYHVDVEAKALELAFASEGLLFPNGELKASLTDEVVKLDRLYFKNAVSFVPKVERLQDLNWNGKVGEFMASGEVNWRTQQGAINARWTDFPLLQRKDRWLVVSGQAGIQQVDKSWSLNGKLAANAAYFQLPKMPPPSLSSDVLISRELKLNAGEDEAAKHGLKTKFDIQLDMGPRFVFVGRGLDTALTGVLRLRGNDQSAVHASGSIATNGGLYDGYGQQLEIERGILSFQGSASNPALNIRALRKGLPVEAGVDVIGTVAKPQVRLVSEPNVPDNEKISWLVLGRGLDQFASADASLLLSAAGAILGGDGSRNLPRELVKGLGFDEFSIGPAENGGSFKLPNQTVAGSISVGSASNDQVVTIGKRMKPGIVLSFERGVSDASNAMKLSWQLGRRIRLVGRKGTDDSVDVKYSFSFN